jgi:hypothetical protein
LQPLVDQRGYRRGWGQRGDSVRPAVTHAVTHRQGSECPFWVVSERPQPRDIRPGDTPDRHRPKPVSGTWQAASETVRGSETIWSHADGQLDARRKAGCERVYVDTASSKLARRPEWDRRREQLRRRPGRRQAGSDEPLDTENTQEGLAGTAHWRRSVAAIRPCASTDRG